MFSHIEKRNIGDAYKRALRSNDPQEKEIGTRLEKNFIAHNKIMTLYSDNNLDNNRIVYTTSQLTQINSFLNTSNGFATQLAKWCFDDYYLLEAIT